ncbi:MAG TPA: tetratricopeptide repeat protein [Phormidium sp.]
MNRRDAEDAERREGGVANSNRIATDTLLTEALAFYNADCLLEAAQKYQEIIQIDNNCADAWHGLGMVYFIQENYQESLEVLSQGLTLDYSNSNLLYSLGLVLEKIGYLDEAIVAYQQVIQLSPQWIEGYHSLGKVFTETGDFAQAKTIYLQAIELDKNSHLSYLYLGNLLMIQQQSDRAINAYQKALQIKPFDSTILNNLGIAFAANNESAQASLYFGYAAYYQAEYTPAIKHFQNFLSTQTGEIDTYLHLSLALQECGQTEEAIQAIDDALNLFPNNLTLKLEKARILPILYKNQQELKFYRQRFTQGLLELIQSTELVSNESKKKCFASYQLAN